MSAIRQDLHKLIDATTDETLLESVFMILSSRQQHEPGILWENLTEEQKQIVLTASAKSPDQSVHISHDEMKNKHSKWLR